jgi:hypothetical protein
MVRHLADEVTVVTLVFVTAVEPVPHIRAVVFFLAAPDWRTIGR